MASIASALVAPLALFALGVSPQADAQSLGPPTVLEAALGARACQAIEVPSTDLDAHLQCVSAQVSVLRASFGKDLTRLSKPDRAKIDAACSPLGTAERRDAYLDCIHRQLAAARQRLAPGAAEAVDATPFLLADPVSTGPAPLPDPSPWTSAAMAAVSVLTAGCVAFLVVWSRRPARACRRCGVSSPESDLCPGCRHEAADAIRRAATERKNQLRVREEEERRQREAEVAAFPVRAEEDLRAGEPEELAHPPVDAGPQPPDESSQAPHATFMREEEAFDPYAVLGAPYGSDPDRIRAAYEQAMIRCDPDLASDLNLGDEVQAHFRAKAESIERAYQMLSAHA